MAILWRDTMSVGVGELDRDHKKMIAMVNAMEAAMASLDQPVIAAVMQQLVTYVADDFQREEELMERHGDPGLAQHKEHHAQAAERIFVLRRRYQAASSIEDKREVARRLHGLLSHWLVNHILVEDLRLRDLVAPKAVTVAAPVAAERGREDVEYSLPPHLAHLLKRIEYDIPNLPPPHGRFESFELLCEAAICRRIDAMLVFFQRSNSDIARELPPLFIASPVFAARLRQALCTFIIPEILSNRQVRMFATRFDWTAADTQTFWEHAPAPLVEAMRERWSYAWDQLVLVERSRDDGSTVWQVKDTTKQLRLMLQPPDDEAYDLPRVGNQEIEVFRSLFQTDLALLTKLVRSWRKCHDLYEQELEPRVFQQRAREGAFRDTLLQVFHELPDHWGEFLVLTCYRVFHRMTTQFLERFATNFGRTDDERRAYMPYLMRTLAQARDIPEIRQRERLEEAEWQAQHQELQNIFKGISEPTA